MVEKGFPFYGGKTMKIKGLEGLVLACFVCLSVCLLPFVVQAADNFLNKDLLEFPKSERDAYLTGAILSVAHTLYLFHSKEMGQCFSDWFLEQPNNRIAEMEEYMRKNPNHAPSSILLGLPQLKCGRLKPKKIKPK